MNPPEEVRIIQFIKEGSIKKPEPKICPPNFTQIPLQPLNKAL